MNYINVLSESSYMETTWYQRIVSGIDNELKPRKEKIKYLKLNEIADLPRGSVLIIIGFTEQFLIETINICIKNDIRPLIVGSNINISNNNKINSVTIRREDAMYENVTNLYASGCKRIALIGPNPQVYTDESHLQGYRLAVINHGVKNIEDDIFYNAFNIEETIERFLLVHDRYDAVVCTNDYVAILLLSKLNELGIKVPDELSITGAGNTDVSRFTDPPLTTIDIPLDIAGKQAITLYRILLESPSINSLCSTFDYKIIYRQSTKINTDTVQSSLVLNDSYTPLMAPDYEKAMKPIWNIANTYATIDDVDRKIIYGIIHNLSNTEIANSVYVSDSTLHYRLNKLYDLTNTNGKNEIKELVTKYFPNYKY